VKHRLSYCWPSAGNCPPHAVSLRIPQMSNRDCTSPGLNIVHNKLLQHLLMNWILVHFGTTQIEVGDAVTSHAIHKGTWKIKIFPVVT
jgi:hypothetical protein